MTAVIPLPVHYSPDEKGVRRPVPDEKFIETAEEIAGGLQAGGTLHVFRGGDPMGFWWDRGVVGRDVLAILEVDITDTPRNRSWLRDYAGRVLLERFQQEAIYIKFIGPVETLVVREEEVRSH